MVKCGRYWNVFEYRPLVLTSNRYISNMVKCGRYLNVFEYRPLELTINRYITNIISRPGNWHIQNVFGYKVFIKWDMLVA